MDNGENSSSDGGSDDGSGDGRNMIAAAVMAMATAMAAVVVMATVMAAVAVMVTAIAIAMVIAMVAVAAMATGMMTATAAVGAITTAMLAATTEKQSVKRRWQWRQWRQLIRTPWRVEGGSSLHKTVEVFTKKKNEPMLDNILVNLIPLFIW